MEFEWRTGERRYLRIVGCNYYFANYTTRDTCYLEQAKVFGMVRGKWKSNVWKQLIGDILQLGNYAPMGCVLFRVVKSLWKNGIGLKRVDSTFRL